MRVKHGTMFKVTVIDRDTREPLEEPHEVSAELLGAHMTVRSAMYNANPYSGGGLWHHPRTGKRISRPKVQIDLVNPDDELKGDELCDCRDCLGS